MGEAGWNITPALGTPSAAATCRPSSAPTGPSSNSTSLPSAAAAIAWPTPRKPSRISSKDSFDGRIARPSTRACAVGEASVSARMSLGSGAYSTPAPVIPTR